MDSITYPILFWLFMIGSVLGTLIEGVFCMFYYKRWETHTVAIWGPFCIIYGIGTVILYLEAVLAENMHLMGQFALFAIATTIVEYIGGLLLKHGVHMKAWDYSGCVLNIQGIICLKMTVAWGILGVLFSTYCVPYIKIAAKAIDFALIKVITFIVSMLMALNLFLTTLCIIRWSRRHRGYPPRSKVEEYLDIKYDNKWMAHRFCEWQFLDTC